MFLIQFYNIYIYHKWELKIQNQKNEDDSTKPDPETENMKIENVIDYTAAKYITTSSFTDMINLHKPEYCDKLVILTSKVIEDILIIWKLLS